MAFYGNGVAIFKALKAELEDRQGRRTDLGLMRKCAEVGPGETTDDLAAKRAGLGDRKTAEQAEIDDRINGGPVGQIFPNGENRKSLDIIARYVGVFGTTGR